MYCITVKYRIGQGWGSRVKISTLGKIEIHIRNTFIVRTNYGNNVLRWNAVRCYHFQRFFHSFVRRFFREGRQKPFGREVYTDLVITAKLRGVYECYAIYYDSFIMVDKLLGNGRCPLL